MPQHTPPRRSQRFGRFVSLAGCAVLTAAIFFSSLHPAFAKRGVAFSFLPDSAAVLDIRQAASMEKAGKYQLYVPSFMAFSRLPETFNGAIWFRIMFGPSFEKPAGDLRLDFGSDMPGITRLYVPQGNDFTVLEASPPSAVFTVPASGTFPDSLYVRIDGTPGLWFRPLLSDAGAEEGGPVSARMLIAGLFGAALLILLLQFIRKAEEWRLWAAITAGCGIAAAVLPSNPAANGAYAPLMAAAMLMPGLMIALFAHTARHLFTAPKNLPGYDALLVMYYALGAVVALTPLVPGFLRASRYLPFAFVAFLPLIFIAIAALARSLKGSGAFLCACLLAIGGVIFSAWELTASETPLIGGLGGLAGLGLGLVLLSLTGPAKTGTHAAAEDDVFDSLQRSCPPEEPRNLPRADARHDTPEEPESTPLPAPPAPAQSKTVSLPAPLSPLPAIFAPADRLAEPAPEPAAPPVQPPAAISLPDDSPASEPPLAEDGPYGPATAEKPDKAIFDLPMLVKNAYDEISPLAEKKTLGMSWFIAPRTGRLFEGSKSLLESALRMLLRDMVGAMDKGNVRLTVRRLPASKDAGHIVFSFTEWDARQTSRARNMAGLSEAWALAERTGGIFSVEHSPTGGTSVIFSCVFTPLDHPKTTEEPPHAPMTHPGEAELSHTRAAEAGPAPAARRSATPQPAEPTPNPAIRHFADHPDTALPDGCDDVSALPVPSVPAGLDGEDLVEGVTAERVPSRLIAADITRSGRTRMRAAFADSPYSVLEGTSPESARGLYARNPSALVIISADMPEGDITAAIRGMHADDDAAGRSPVPVLALVEGEAQAGRMILAGCAKTLTKPVEDDALLAAVLALAPLESASPEPAAPERHDRPEQEAGSRETIFVPAEALEPAAPGEGFLKETPGVTPETVLTESLRIPPAASPPADGIAPAEAARSAIFTAALPGEKQENPAKPDGTGEQYPRRGPGLIDMIITDEEENAAPAQTAPEAAAPTPEAAAPTPEAAAPTPEAIPEPKAAPAHAAPVPNVAEQTRRITVTVTGNTPVEKTTAPGLRDPAPSFDAAQPPASALIADDGTFMQGGDGPPSSDISVRLPGEEDGVFKDMIPLIPGLIHDLSDAMADAGRGRKEKSPLLVQEAAERVAGKAEAFGLARLERMARCVERAAAADDIEPMECVLDDLVNWIERYKEALARLHRDRTW